MADTSTHSWKLLYEAGRQALQDRKLQAAEQSFSAALQLAEDFAPSDPRLAATLNALARIYSLQRRYLAAAALLNRLLEVTERTLGPCHVQVAGVLTNLAEMYTHLGAAREELELRERVLGIRVDDPNADATSLQRLADRVSELRAMLVAQEASPTDEDEIEYEPIPTVRTDEYTSPISSTREPEPETVPTVVYEPEPVVTAAIPSAQSASVIEDDDFRRAQAAAQLTTPRWSESAGHTIETYTYTGSNAVIVPSAASVEMISISERRDLTLSGTVDHGFSDMGRDELSTTVHHRIGGRSSLYSIAAGVILVAGLLAARDYMNSSPDDERESAGSVSLAATMAPPPPQVVVTPVAQVVPEPAPDPEPRTVERLIADRLAERQARRANEERASSNSSERTPRVPSAAELERTLKSLDVAVKAIDQRTKAATDSASAIRLQTPAFKKVRMADPTSGPMVVVP